MDEILEEFVLESAEQLAEVETILMELEAARAHGDQVDPADVDTVFRAFHSIKGSAGFLDLPAIVELTHEAESVLDELRAGRLELSAEMISALCSALDLSTEMLATIKETGSDEQHAAQVPPVVAELSACLAPSAPDEVFPLDDAAEQDGAAQPEDGDLAVVVDLAGAEAGEQQDERGDGTTAAPEDATGADEEARPEGAAETDEAARPADAAEPEGDGLDADAARRTRTQLRGESIRVDVDKLDELMNLVGELILAETMVTHNEDLEGLRIPSFHKAARNLNRITRDLQDIAMSVRMVPIRSTFAKMRRLVFELAQRQGKSVDLRIVGDQTEVDKNLIESIADPLVHMMRNAVDHGLETPEERRAAGKPDTGTITLEARHQSGEVWIMVSDDGRGLDRDVIAAKAVERGLVADTTGMTDPEVFELVFEPGFSTASALSDVSGRGVGMDVVRRNMDRVRGRVEVTSELGRGTTVTMRIPLTLAIIDGMVVRVADQHYTIPVLSVQESVPGSGLRVTELPDGREFVTLRGAQAPLVRLGERYDVPDAADVEHGIVVMCSDGSRTMGILVDSLVGQRQTVIKALPGYLGSRTGFAGCSILANGEVSLILELGALAAGSDPSPTRRAA